MKSKLLAPTAIWLSLTVLAFVLGYHLGTRRLSQCEAHNKQLFDDLMTAVKHGVAIETDLILCKEHGK